MPTIANTRPRDARLFVITPWLMSDSRILSGVSPLALVVGGRIVEIIWLGVNVIQDGTTGPSAVELARNRATLVD